jgi:hypothetical protein
MPTMNIADSDEKLNDDDDEVEYIRTKRKRRGEISEDDDGNGSDVEEVQDDSNQRAESVKE